MDRFELQKLRDLPIEGVAERLGLQVSRHKCLCPFHNDSNPSLSFNVRKNTFHCFVCGASGNTIDLVMRLLNFNFPEACRWLDKRDSIIVEKWKAAKVLRPDPPLRPFDAGFYLRFFEHPVLCDEAKQFLFEERKLDPRVISWCRITSWQDRDGNKWLQTPYFDMDGKLVNIQNRNLKKGATPKFKFPSGTLCGIYNLPILQRLQPNDDLYLAEGCSDCWAMLSAGYKAIAIPSATLLKSTDLELVAQVCREKNVACHMFPDQDTPGESLCLQVKEGLPDLTRHQLPRGCKDFSEYYVQGKSIDNGTGSTE